MADLIDRDALMKKICGNECGDVCDKECENSWCSFYDYIMDAPAVNRWIPCNEKLPEDGENVLITYGKEISKAWHDSHMHKFYISDSDFWYRDDCIMYWMPLPDPPQEVLTDGSEI